MSYVSIIVARIFKRLSVRCTAGGRLVGAIEYREERDVIDYVYAGVEKSAMALSMWSINEEG